MTPLATTLRQLREARGLTQRQLAQAAGINRATLQGLEQSRVFRPHRHIVDALADALGVEPDAITTDVFDPARPKNPRPVPSSEPSEPSEAPRPTPPPPSLVRLAQAVQAHDPTALVALDEDGPAVAVWLTDRTLLYLRSARAWADHLRSVGVAPPDDLAAIELPRPPEQSRAAKATLNALFRQVSRVSASNSQRAGDDIRLNNDIE